MTQRTAQLLELTRQLQTAREDERCRLAHDLHDELGSLLTSAKLDAVCIKMKLADESPDGSGLIAHLIDTLNSGIALGRRIIEDLRPSTLTNLGLVEALEILVHEFAERVGVEAHLELIAVTLTPATELVVHRLVQEAVTNITKRSKVSHVWLSLGMRRGRVEVSVRDDGVGFDAAIQPKSAYGLVGMSFRFEAEGGALALVSAPGPRHVDPGGAAAVGAVRTRTRRCSRWREGTCIDRPVLRTDDA